MGDVKGDWQQGMEMDLSDIIMPFTNEKLIPFVVREDAFGNRDQEKYEDDINYLIQNLQNIYDLVIDEDDKEVNEVWKVYTETEVSGRLCA